MKVTNTLLLALAVVFAASHIGAQVAPPASPSLPTTAVTALPLPSTTIDSMAATDAAVKKTLEAKLDNAPVTSIGQVPTTININYKDAPLVNIVNELAAKRGINILLPQGAQAIPTKITYSLPQKLTLAQAWAKINSILELLGYTWIDHKEYLALKKIDGNTKREGLPLYVDVPINELPDTPDMIQAIFYLANIKVSDQDNPIKGMLDDPNVGMLSKDAYVLTDEKTNALIITDHANTLKAAMTIIKDLDLEGVPDAIEVMPLYYVQSSFVEALFKELLTQPQDQGGTTALIPTARKGIQQSSYFPSNTKIMGIERSNSIVIMGSLKAIQVVRDFIIKYIDHPLESGKSILHIYELQYLSAEEFAPVLQSLVGSTQGSQTGQSTTQATGGGPRRDFQDVIIVAEITKQVSQIAPTTADSSGNTAAPISQGVQQGGNRLIIAARDKDWQRIRAIIKELDIAQPQVALEVLVVDLVMERTRDLGSQLRNPASTANVLGPNLNFQSAQLDQPILQPPIENIGGSDAGNFINFPANALMANLLQFFPDQPGVNIANESVVGTLVISLQDPGTSGTWNVWRVLSKYTNASLLAQPFIFATDNKQATITLTEARYLTSNAAADGGAIKTQQEWVVAPITIDLTPRISKLANTVNLQVAISVDEFISDANNRLTRQVQTNANVGDGEVLAIGGIMRDRDDIQDRKVPLLGDIPLFGWFFKFKTKVRNKTNLLIFITPHIIRSNKPGSVGPFTENKLCTAQKEMDEHFNMVELRDPITRWFFKPDPNFGARTVEVYREGKLSQHDNITNSTLVADNTTLKTFRALEPSVVPEQSMPSSPASSTAIAQATSAEPATGRRAKTTRHGKQRHEQIKKLTALVKELPEQAPHAKAS